MKKRGQATVFIVIGIVILVIMSLLFYFKDSVVKAARLEPSNPQEYLNQQLADIKSEFGRCVIQETNDAVKLLMENGGVFERKNDFIRYNKKNYPVLCVEFNNSDNIGCMSRPLLLSDFKIKLDSYLLKEINSCLNLNNFKNKDYELKLGDMKINSGIFNDYIIINVDRIIELNKSSVSVKSDKFNYKINAPLGELTLQANKLVQERAGGKRITPVTYGLSSFNKYKLVVSRPYPDELYDLSLTTNDKYHFYFSVLGNGSHASSVRRLK